MKININTRKFLYIFMFFMFGFISTIQSVNAYDTSPLGESGVVTYIVDGDTFDMENMERIRLADLDCPEMDTTEGQQANDYTESLIDGVMVYLDIDDKNVYDPYDRVVAIVYVSHNDTHYLNLNYHLTIAGHAIIKDFDTNEFDPDTWEEYVAKSEFESGDVIPMPFIPVFLFTMAGIVFLIGIEKKN